MSKFLSNPEHAALVEGWRRTEARLSNSKDASIGQMPIEVFTQLKLVIESVHTIRTWLEGTILAKARVGWLREQRWSLMVRTENAIIQSGGCVPDWMMVREPFARAEPKPILAASGRPYDAPAGWVPNIRDDPCELELLRNRNKRIAQNQLRVLAVQAVHFDG